MIRTVEGDILLSKADAIAHGIAPHDHFDSGLALALRERWPSLVKDYRHAAHSKEPEVGSIWSWSGVGEHGGRQTIVNLLTQNMQHEGKNARPGRATLENVGHCLHKLATFIKHEKLTSVALPKLATGVGGLEWQAVKPLIEKYLGDLGIPVILYEVYHKGVQADEKLAAKG